ncbi:ankyrin repeat family protein [Martensiomyces pterosporus]|nr:ankyrin repeat family protein [Martensiomyces pterosporus]
MSETSKDQQQQQEEDKGGASKEALLLAACYEGNSQRAKELVDEGAEIFVTDETGRTALHFAAASGDVDTVKFVLESGIPWNSLDSGSYTAGDYAENGGHDAVYEALVQAGIRAEMVLRLFSSDEPSDGKAANEDYLSQPVEYSGDRLVDAEKNGVMMSWEAPLMELHAKTICSRPDSVVLNVGFGMGIIDTALQELGPGKHVIVEAHPDVYKHMKDEGWDKKPNVHILFGRWQDKLDEIRALGPYDSIFFDTFGEFYKDLDDFHKAIFKSDDASGLRPILRQPDGVYSFFNGLGGDHKLFHDVYCHIARADLLKLGVSTEYSQVSSDVVMDEETWRGIKRPYWMIKSYNLPTCQWARKPE